jgi:amidohydrolase
MEIIKKIQEIQLEMTRWRQKLHMEPELAFEERATARLITRNLQNFGVDEIHGLAKTGVVGVLHGKNGSASETGGKSIMLRVTMDALPMKEESGVTHASGRDGVHHGCGHDGHMAMLLGAAKYLAQSRDFDGTIYFVFQPAEENLDGAQASIEEGLFEKFPCDEVYSVHGYPSLPIGTMASEPGAMLAASEEFHITLKGTGGQLPHPENTTDLVAALSEAVSALKTMTQEEIPVGNPAALLVTSVRTDSDAADIISGGASLKGSLRTYDSALHAKLKENLERIIDETAAKYGATATVEFRNEYVSLNNSLAETEFAISVAKEIVGDSKVVTPPRTLSVEDFARYLQEKPGNFMAIGTGRADGKETPALHSSKYDFNDSALPIGASYLARLAERALPSKGRPAPGL